MSGALAAQSSLPPLRREARTRSRVQMIKDVVQLKKPARVPFLLTSGIYPLCLCRRHDRRGDVRLRQAELRLQEVPRGLPARHRASLRHGRPRQRLRAAGLQALPLAGPRRASATAYQASKASTCTPTSTTCSSRTRRTSSCATTCRGSSAHWPVDGCLGPFTDIIELPFTGRLHGAAACRRCRGLPEDCWKPAARRQMGQASLARPTAPRSAR